MTEKIQKIKELLLKHEFQECFDAVFLEEACYVFFDKTWSEKNGGAKYLIYIDKNYISCRDISDENFYMGHSIFGFKLKKLNIEKLNNKLKNLSY